MRRFRLPKLKTLIYLSIAGILACWLLVPKKPPLPQTVQAKPTIGLSEAEQSYYSQIFSYTMDNIEGGESHDWESFGGHGNIEVSTPFVSNFGMTCRPFTETFVIGIHAGEISGIGCRREGREGWCKLKKSDALTCAMETPGSMVDFNIPGTHFTTPTVSIPGGGIGQVGTPNVDPNFNTNVNGPDRVDTPSGTGVADKVTGAAGSVAGPVTRGTMDWFSKTFR